MSNDENKEEAPETPNSQEPTTVPSEAPAVEEDDQVTTKKPAEESEVIVIKPSEVEYKESNRIEYSSAEEQDKGEGEQSVAVAKAKEAEQSFTEMIKSLGKKAMTKAEEKTKEIKDKSVETLGTGTQKDAKDIQALGIQAENVIIVFEKIMAEIEREDYESQEKLLVGYKKLLEEQINVIDSKQNIAKRLKDIS
ncbi:MAG: hypothetical protein WCA39_13510 [Nitrososphaeraceae archaeon]